MNARNPQQEGGLVLKRADLQQILDEPGTLGIAFALKAPGQANNVDLDVLRVSVQNNRYIGELRPIPEADKKAAEGPLHYPSGRPNQFYFHHLTKLEADGYFFGYYDDFKRLFEGREDWDEIFIGGGKQTYPPGTYDQDEWFTFNIAARKSIPEVVLLAAQPAEELVAAHWPGVRSILMPFVKKRGTVRATEVAGKDPFLSSVADMNVQSVIKAEQGAHLEGVVFEEGIALLFEQKMPIRSIQLNQDHKLKKIYLVEKEPPAPGVEESTDLGASFPFSDYTIGCPPQWPENGSQQTEGLENNIKLAVEEALSII